MRYLCFFLLLLVSQWAVAQSEDLIFVNGLDINQNRYPDVKDSPYLFKDDWHPADLLGKDMKRVPNMPTRYNMYTGEFEVRNKDKFIRLATSQFMRIEFEVNEKGKPLAEGEEKFIFQAGFHPRFQDRFVNVIYSGPMMVVFRDYRSNISEKTIQNVGETVAFKRFFTKVEYYMLQGGELKAIRNNKNSIIKLLGHKKELEAFIKENKTDFDSVSDLKKLFTFAETLN
ncbi:MAG: hypothetical protein R2824_09130 [Saprospiraceae bacterium]|nr:hypothetical protein [Lewinella sp.]